jgi:hypothetical protein
MPQTRPNRIQVPIGSDPYALTPDLATMADTVNPIIPVANQTERDALPVKEGLTVIRADLDGEIQIYINGAWKVRPAKVLASYANGSTAYGNGFSPVWIQEMHAGFYYASGMFKPGTSADGTMLVGVPLEMAPDQPVNKGVFYRTTGSAYGIAFAQLSTDRWMRFYGLPSTTDYVSIDFGWWKKTSAA